MRSKLIILLVFTSMAQSAYFPTLKVNYGLSEKEANVFHKILVSQQDTLTTFVASYGTLFDTIVDFKAEAAESCSQIAKALSIMKNAVDLLLHPDVVVLGESCSAAIECARKRGYAIFSDIFARFGISLKLAGSGNYSKNRAAIESQHAAVSKGYKNLVDIDYDTVNICLHTRDPDVLSIIENARNCAQATIIRLVTGIFNAIKVYAAAVPVACGDVNLTFHIEDFRNKVFASTKSYIVYKFSTLRTLYINSRLNENGILSAVALSQYAEVVSFLEYKEGNDGILGIAMSYLRRIDLGIYDDVDDNAFTATNVSYAKIIAAYDIGNEVLLDLLSFVNPDSSSSIDAAREYLHTVSVEGNIVFIEAFDVAATRGKNLSETLERIETLKEAAVSPASDYTQYIFDLIRNNRTLDQETEDTFRSLQNVTYYGAAINTIKFFDAAVILANARYKGVVIKEDYCAIQVLLDESNQALDGFTQGITAACLLLFRVTNAH